MTDFSAFCQFRKSFSFLLRLGWRGVGASCVSSVSAQGETGVTPLRLLFPRDPLALGSRGSPE